MNGQTAPNEALTLNDVAFSYLRKQRRIPIFESVSLSVSRGECIAILGESGGGKSTLLELASGIRVPHSGSVVLDGVNLTTLNDEARAAVRLAKMGFVRQDFDLLDNLAAVQNVALAKRLRGGRRPDAEAAARIHLTELGLAKRLDHRPGELSGGEKQRVAIARAIITEPLLVLADEPTGSLDASLRDEALEVLQQACAGRSLVVVTHDQHVANKLADRTFVLQEGHLAERS
jgi:ABC-type lipoprotein export system ATPase subunit